MILLQCASVYLTPPKFSTESRKLPDSFLSPNSLLRSSVFKSNPSSKASFKRSCAQNEDAHEASIQGFSVLAGDIPWDRGSIWSTMAFYMFCLHIPLSFGGLSVVAAILHEPLLDPETEWTAKPRYNFLNLLRANTLSGERNWLLASVLGFGFLFLLVFLTSILADRLIGPRLLTTP
ncbi:hypothetical protein I3843_04G115100 [Carya illinoinensis]|nr:hypothetical protein I3843_04G115100 [Carya illinoinensis]